MNPTKTTEWIASELYKTYCAEVGGKAFNGDSLPTWDEFRSDEKKKKQSDAWIAVALTAERLFV